MIKVEELFIAPTATVLETLRKLDETGQRILFIAPEGHLKAVITDGDIRRAMESSQDKFFQLKMEDIMTRTPKMVSPETKVTEIEDIMHRNKIHCVLVVDEERHLLGVVDSFRTMI